MSPSKKHGEIRKMLMHIYIPETINLGHAVGQIIPQRLNKQ